MGAGGGATKATNSTEFGEGSRGGWGSSHTGTSPADPAVELRKKGVTRATRPLTCANVPPHGVERFTLRPVISPSSRPVTYPPPRVSRAVHPPFFTPDWPVSAAWGGTFHPPPPLHCGCDWLRRPLHHGIAARARAKTAARDANRDGPDSALGAKGSGRNPGALMRRARAGGTGSTQPWISRRGDGEALGRDAACLGSAVRLFPLAVPAFEVSDAHVVLGVLPGRASELAPAPEMPPRYGASQLAAEVPEEQEEAGDDSGGGSGGGGNEYEQQSQDKVEHGGTLEQTGRHVWVGGHDPPVRRAGAPASMSLGSSHASRAPVCPHRDASPPSSPASGGSLVSWLTRTPMPTPTTSPRPLAVDMQCTCEAATAPVDGARDPTAGSCPGQRKTPVWPREYRPGCGNTHSPCGPLPTRILARSRPVTVEIA
jgi:hypothetical protein